MNFFFGISPTFFLAIALLHMAPDRVRKFWRYQTFPSPPPLRLVSQYTTSYKKFCWPRFTRREFRFGQLWSSGDTPDRWNQSVYSHRTPLNDLRAVERPDQRFPYGRKMVHFAVSGVGNGPGWPTPGASTLMKHFFYFLSKYLHLPKNFCGAESAGTYLYQSSEQHSEYHIANILFLRPRVSLAVGRKAPAAR